MNNLKVELPFNYANYLCMKDVIEETKSFLDYVSKNPNDFPADKLIERFSESFSKIENYHKNMFIL